MKSLALVSLVALGAWAVEYAPGVRVLSLDAIVEPDFQNDHCTTIIAGRNVWMALGVRFECKLLCLLFFRYGHFLCCTSLFPVSSHMLLQVDIYHIHSGMFRSLLQHLTNPIMSFGRIVHELHIKGSHMTPQ